MQCQVVDFKLEVVFQNIFICGLLQMNDGENVSTGGSLPLLPPQDSHEALQAVGSICLHTAATAISAEKFLHRRFLGNGYHQFSLHRSSGTWNWMFADLVII